MDRNWTVWGNENPDGPYYKETQENLLCPYCLTNEVDFEGEMCFECRMNELEMREKE